MEKKFTKGTWVIDSDFITVEVDGIDEVICDFDPEGVWPTVYQRSEEEKDANAKLIAAAPDLLDALECIYNDKEVWSELSDTQKIMVEQAIKKATV